MTGSLSRVYRLRLSVGCFLLQPRRKNGSKKPNRKKGFSHYETFINQTFSEVPPPAPKKEKSADDITAEFAPIIEADRRKGG